MTRIGHRRQAHQGNVQRPLSLAGLRNLGMIAHVDQQYLTFRDTGDCIRHGQGRGGLTFETEHGAFPLKAGVAPYVGSVSPRSSHDSQ